MCGLTFNISRHNKSCTRTSVLAGIQSSLKQTESQKVDTEGKVDPSTCKRVWCAKCASKDKPYNYNATVNTVFYQVFNHTKQHTVFVSTDKRRIKCIFLFCTVHVLKLLNSILKGKSTQKFTSTYVLCIFISPNVAFWLISRLWNMF